MPPNLKVKESGGEGGREGEREGGKGVGRQREAAPSLARLCPSCVRWGSCASAPLAVRKTLYLVLSMPVCALTQPSHLLAARLMWGVAGSHAQSGNS